MESPKALANRFREVLLDGTWVAQTNFREALAGSHWREVIQTIGELNSIAALAQHVHYYIAGIRLVLEGGPLAIRDRYSFDFPLVASQEQWNAFLARFFNDVEMFATLVEQMDDEKLDAPFIDPKYGTYRRNIEAMIEHSYYHLGQIVLLQKMSRIKPGDIS